jgi:spore maturation protein SpmB
MMDATTPEPAYLQRLQTCLIEGAGKGLRSGIRLLAIIIPVSFLVMLLSWSGVLRWAAQWMAPLFGHIGLPGEAALAFITGAFINLYAGIAAMSAMTLTARQLTILAVISLISHNLPVEVAVQHKAGSSGPRLLIMRLLTSATAGLLLHRTMPAGPPEPVITSVLAAGSQSFAEALTNWGLDAGFLAAKVLVIIVVLMVLLRILTEFGLIQQLSRPLWPVLAVLGLPRSTAFLWIVANTLGLAYGAGVILEEVRTGMIEKRDVDLLNHSIAVCHSLLEDTLLFVAIGAWWMWLIFPRLFLAAAVVWLKRLETRWRKPATSSVSD